MLGNMTEETALPRLTYWEGEGKKIYCTPFVPRVLLTSLTLLLKRGQSILLLKCRLQQKAHINLRHFANAILLILYVLLPIALNFYCFSFMKKKWFIASTMEADLSQTNPATWPSIDAKYIIHLLFQLAYHIPWKNPPWERGAIHIRKLFCWSLPTKATSLKHKIVRAFLIQIIHLWGSYCSQGLLQTQTKT